MTQIICADYEPTGDMKFRSRDEENISNYRTH